MRQVHGGPDAFGPVRWDFSTNVNAAGPCPQALAAVQAAEPRHYPDAGYHALCDQLAAWHGVARWRVLLAASGSEFIQRFTAVSARLAPGPVALPAQAYGDYARAALACGRAVTSIDDATATLRWACEPSSPLGQPCAPPPIDNVATVLDAVYAPLRLDGRSAWPHDHVFVLHSPNKAMGLAGVRAAYAIAPADARWQSWADALNAAAPSWPIGAHGVALVSTWATDEAQAWLNASLTTLRDWKQMQQHRLIQRGLTLQTSVTPFFCARVQADPAHLRQHGVMWRDCTSFGLPGWARLNTMPPAAQAALDAALDTLA